MTETVSGAVSALHGTAERLEEAALALTTADPGPGAFGAGAPGRLGEAGRGLSVVWQRALDARVREARSHAARLHELADLAGRAAGGLHDVNQSVRQPEVP
jgi:hypothetical protein